MPPKRKRGVYHGSNKRRRVARFNVRRSRVIRRRRGRGGYLKAIDQHMYSRYAHTPLNLDCTTGELPICRKFEFADITAHGEFSSLYDRYKITSVQLQITLINNPDAFLQPNGPLNNQNITNWYPKLWYVRDYDDASDITLSAIRERSNVRCLILRPNKIFRFRTRPAVLMQTWQSLTGSGYAPKWNNWIDMAQSTVPHYGIKMVLDTQGLDPSNEYPFKVRIEFKYNFTCKNVL